MIIYTFRLRPGMDLLDEIEHFVAGKMINAGCVLCSVGSLNHATLRLANREQASEYEGHFEIVSLMGTVSANGSHLHISMSDNEGKTIGGHLESGCKIYTTAEIVLGAFEDMIFRREELENDSGYAELVIYPPSYSNSSLPDQPRRLKQPARPSADDYFSSAAKNSS